MGYLCGLTRVGLIGKSKKRRKWTWYRHKKRPMFLSIRHNKEIFLVRKRKMETSLYHYAGGHDHDCRPKM